MFSNIGDIYNFIKALCNKDGRGYVTPEETGMYLGVAQQAVFNAYKNTGRLDNETDAAKAPFIVDYDFVANQSGVFNRPSNYVMAERIVAGGKEYTPIQFNELRDALVSQMEPIAQYPRYMEKGNTIQLYPTIAVRGTLTYLRLPATPVIGYVPDGTTGLPVYNAGTSVQLELPKNLWPAVVLKAMPYLGLSLGAEDVAALNQTAEA